MGWPCATLKPPLGVARGPPRAYGFHPGVATSHLPPISGSHPLFFPFLFLLFNFFNLFNFKDILCKFWFQVRIFESFHKFDWWKEGNGMKIVVSYSLLVDVSVHGSILTMTGSWWRKRLPKKNGYTKRVSHATQAINI
jgi:hypothetical protein